MRKRLLQVDENRILRLARTRLGIEATPDMLGMVAEQFGTIPEVLPGETYFAAEDLPVWEGLEDMKDVSFLVGMPWDIIEWRYPSENPHYDVKWHISDIWS